MHDANRGNVRSFAMNTLRVLGMLALAAVVACGPSSEAESGAAVDLADLVEDQRAIIQELEGRVDVLEERLGDDGPSTGSGSAPTIGELIEHVEQLTESIDAFGDDLAAERSARLDLGLLLDDFERDVRDSIADLRDTVVELRALIEDLEIRYEVLQSRIDQMQQ